MKVINQYLASVVDLKAVDAWRHVYRLLLWIDPTNGLVHAYESDKSQPGKHWHARAVRVTDKVAGEFGVEPRALQTHLDLLFRACLAETARRDDARTPTAVSLIAEADVDTEDPSGVIAIVEKLLGGDGQRDLARKIAGAVRLHLAIENKRKNILGEGFEDVMSALIERIAHVPADRFKLRGRLSELPGYREPNVRRKEKRPDIAIIQAGRRTEMLISTKWSVRADREDQFADEYQFYIDHQTQAQPPETVLMTNEFDRARLASAVESPRFRFDRVVHVQPELLVAAYGADLDDLTRIMRQRKLISLGDFLTEMTSRFAAPNA